MKPTVRQTVGARKARNSIANLRFYLQAIANTTAHPKRDLATKLLFDFSAQLGGEA